MEPDDREFIEEAARRLDESLEELEAQEAHLVAQLGDERAKELRSFWLSEFDDVDMEEMRRGLDFDDRSLLHVWSRLHRNRDRRARAGRSAMILNAGRTDLDAAPPKSTSSEDV
jgi:hypothetical protein